MKTKEAHRSYPQVFCPALNAIPDRLLQARFFGETEVAFLGVSGRFCRCLDDCTVSYVLGFDADSVDLSRPICMLDDAERPVPQG